MSARKILWVGDPHATPDDLDDCEALAGFIVRVAEEEEPDETVISGDLYNTHSIIHAEVQRYWRDVLRAIPGDKRLIKGNHDGPHDPASRATALLAHLDQATVVAFHPDADDEFLYCPYAHRSTDLIAWSHDHPGQSVMFCHNTFDGSRYETGFFAGDGVEPGAILQPMIISGHIHTPQEFGKVWYPGAPRWRTLADANVQRAIWLLTFDGGRLVERQPFDTGAVCRRILQVEDAEDAPYDETQRPAAKDELHVTVRGSRAWIEQRSPLYDGWARVHPACTDARDRVVVRESEGVGVAFDKYLDAYTPKRGTSKEVLRRMVGERIHGFAG